MKDDDYNNDYSPKKAKLKHPLLLGILIGIAILLVGAGGTYALVASQNTIRVSLVPPPTPTPQVTPLSISTGYVIQGGSYQPVAETLNGVCTQDDVTANSFNCGQRNVGDTVTYTLTASCVQGWHEVPHLANGYSADHQSSVLSHLTLPPLSTGFFLIRNGNQYLSMRKRTMGTQISSCFSAIKPSLATRSTRFSMSYRGYRALCNGIKVSWAWIRSPGGRCAKDCSWSLQKENRSKGEV